MLFDHLVHADWSANPPGRWFATAARVGQRWRVEAPQRVPADPAFLARLQATAATGPMLAGFDFPIGLPVRYGETCGFADFPAALAGFGADVYRPAERPEEIGRDRPFYPARPGAARRQHLLDGHEVSALSELTRRCERGGAGLKAAGCLFWTLGASQVGRAALHGWRHVVGPARAAGARLWPFDGDLTMLAGQGGLTLAETYPADAYRRLGAPFAPRQSKRRQGDRAGKAPAIAQWAKGRDVTFSPAFAAALHDGFGAADKGGDAFDAAMGLLAMIDVLGRDEPPPPSDPAVRRWEGWILGRPPVPP